MNEPEVNAAPLAEPNPAPKRDWNRSRPLTAGWLILLVWAVIDGKFTVGSRWAVGWELGLITGVLGGIFMGLPHAALQYAVLAALERFTRLPPRARAWLINGPVLAFVAIMLGGRLNGCLPGPLFERFVNQRAPSSLRVLDWSCQKFDMSEPKMWSLHFTVSPADWAQVTNGYSPVARVTDHPPKEDEELQELELKRLRQLITRSGSELPFAAPFLVLRRSAGDMADAVGHGLHPGWGDFLFFREAEPGEAFFLRGPIGDDLARMSAP